MKKSTLILTSLILALTLASCGQQNPDSPDTTEPKSETTASDTTSSDTTKPDVRKDDNPDSEITPASIEKAIADAVGSDNYLCTDWFANHYGLDMSKVKSYVAKQSAIVAVDPDTVIVLDVEDGYADTAVELLNKSYAQTVSYIRQYPFGVGKVVNARICKEGNYVMYILAGASYTGDDAEKEDELAVAEYAKIDAALKDLFGETPENLAVVPEDDGNGGGLVIDDDDMDDGLLGG